MRGEKYDVLVIGGGPAGLRAAEMASAAGRRTALADRMPSVGRKFLVAGRGGLNLTHSEPVENFPARYGEATDRWRTLLADFSPEDLREWAKVLGIETFIGTSGRVFPTSKQAAPLLRRWIERLRKQKVEFHLRHRFSELKRREEGWFVGFETPKGTATIATRAVVLALGGASWPQTGSDGGWVGILRERGVAIKPLVPANCGWEVDWPAEFLAAADGLPLKNIAVRADDHVVHGELLITKYGLEGGAIYQLGRALRNMEKPQIEIDLKPTFSAEELASKPVRAWKLSKAAAALLRRREPFAGPLGCARLVKAYQVTLRWPRPIEEAISTAGGVKWDELDDNLMLRRLPGVFCAGEMIDWEAPTGGYLLQGSFSTATRATRGALAFLHSC
jgi:uncharacterized flavoprotein (TIGR03862 family)